MNKDNNEIPNKPQIHFTNNNEEIPALNNRRKKSIEVPR